MSKLKFQAKGIGRRKKASATVLLFLPMGKPGGEIVVNNRSVEDYFQYNLNYLKGLKAPLIATELVYDIAVKVSGGGLTGQAKAVQLAISRALTKLDSDNRALLKRPGFLSCDSRVKERRKYGLKKARKASQFSKR